MTRIATKSDRYRTRTQISRDLATVLNSDLHWRTQHAVIGQAAWVWSEFNGKYDGCEHWSPAAWRARRQKQRLMHEHLVPKKLLIERLRKLQGRATPPAVYALMARYCIGVVITRSEDIRLRRAGLRDQVPEDTLRSDVWARYRVARIPVVRFPGSHREKRVAAAGAQRPRRAST